MYRQSFLSTSSLVRRSLLTRSFSSTARPFTSGPLPVQSDAPSVTPGEYYKHQEVRHQPTPEIPHQVKEWDAVIIGGGHNGLVASAYLAKSGLKNVLVLERRHTVGGAAVTEEINPGFKYSRASYLFSLFRPQIVQDLDLKRHGLRFLFRDPSSFTPMHEGRYLLMGKSTEFTQEQIAKFSKRDAQLYPIYEEHLTRLTSFFEPFLDAPPPGDARSWEERIDQLKTLMKVGKNAWNLGREVMDFHEILTAPAERILNRWFESEPLKSTLATDAVIGAMTSPSTPGSGYVLFHHVMGEVEGRKGAWAFVQGGMGAVSQAIASAAKEAGVSIHTNTVVSKIDIRDGKAVGVVLADGREIKAKKVISNATPHITFLRLMDKKDVPTHFRRHIEHLDTTSPVTKINVSLDRLPNFLCCPNKRENEAGPQHRGTIHLVENCAQIEAGYRDAMNGIPSRTPVIELTIPSAVDNTLAPPGKHVASLFVQYTPYNIAGGWSRGAREDFAKTCFQLIDEYAPGFSNSILHYEMLAPPDLERVFGLTGGNIFHHSMGLDQLFWLRPVSGFARHRTPIPNLYICGAGAHPGGGVMGSPGRNAAKIIQYDLKAGGK